MSGWPKTLFSGLTGSWDPQTLNTCRPLLAADTVRAMMPGGSPLAWPMAGKETPVGIKYAKDARPPLFHLLERQKSATSPMLIANFRNVWFLKSCPPALQSSSRKQNWKDKSSLQNNHVKASHKITFLIITWCFKLAMCCAHLFPLKRWFLLRATMNCVCISQVNLFLCILFSGRLGSPSPLLEHWPHLLRNWTDDP